MRKLLLLVCLLSTLSPLSKAQGGNTTVTATILDPNGAVYTNSQVNITFVEPTTPGRIALLNGSTFQKSFTVFATDSFGHFSISLPDTGVIDSSSVTSQSQWSFRVIYSDRVTSFVYVTPINCAANIPSTCTAGVMDISSQLQASAALLPATAGGGGSFVVRTPPCNPTMNLQMAGRLPNTANTAFDIAMNCNVTSTSITQAGGGSIQLGSIAQFTLIQDGIGNRTFAWPTNFTDQPPIQVSAGATTNASFWYDGTNWHAQTFPASGGGGSNPAGVSGDIQKNNGSGGLSVAKINDNGSTILVTEPISSNSSITSPSFISSTANPALTGSTRLASTDTRCWRNNANSGDVCLSKNASDNLLWPNSLSVGGTLISGSSGGTATLPNNTGTVAELNFAQAWTAIQSFGPGNLVPVTAGATDIGSASLPFGSLWLGNAATNNFKVAGVATAPRIATLPDATFTFAGTTVPLGGTGASTFTTNGILFGNGTGALQATAAGGAGAQCLVETAGGAPSFSACSGAAATAWSALSNPSADLSLNMGTNNTLFTSGVVTGTRHAWELVDGNSTSTGSLFNLHTGATSTMKPFTATAQGTANGIQMGTTGILAPIGTGGITANTWTPSLTVNQLLFGNGASPSTLSPLVGSLVGTNPVLALTSALTTSVPFALNTPASPSADIFDLSINSVKTSWVDNLGIWHAPSYTATGSGPLVLTGTEGSCPVAAVGVDILCIGNIGTHTIQSSLNGTTFKDVPQWSNSGPTAHGVVVTGTAFPQTNSTSAGTLGQAFISQGAAADPIFSTLGAVGGGLGTVTQTIHGVLVGEGTSPVVAVGPNATANLPLLNQVGADPIYGPLPLGSTTLSGQVPIPNGGTGAATLAAANIAVFTGAITPNNCVKWSSATVITDSGGTCGGAGGAARLDQITAATASNTINSTINPQIWNWALTGSTTAHKFGENTAATGSNNIILQASTLNTSTAAPFQADSNGNGYQLNSSGLFKPIGTGALSTPGAAHNLVVSQAGSAAVTYIPPVTAGKVLIDNGPGNDPSFQDPIVSQAFVNLWTTQDVTVTRTSPAVRNPIFSQTGTLQLTWASITGSPATCTLQIQGVDSVGNSLNNGSTFSVSPANGTTSQTFTAAASLQSAAQIKAIFSCVTYPTTGTLTLDYTPIPNVNVTNTVTVTGTVTTTPPANASTNISQINGVTPLMGNGTTGTGSQRVTIASDNTAFSVNSTLSAETTKVIGTVRNVGNAGASIDGATGAAPPANAIFIAGLKSGATGGFLTGITACDLDFNINISTATTTLAVTGVSGRQVRICSIHLLNNSADNVALIEGTGATCGTGTAGMAGGTTSASGYNFPANGGLTLGTGIGEVMTTATTGDSVCIVTSAATQLSGHIKYTIY